MNILMGAQMVLNMRRYIPVFI